MAEELATEQLLAQGREAFARDDYPQALRSLREVAAREPGYADVHNMIGICLNLVGQPREAVEAFDRAVEINPRYVDALVNRAITLNDLGEYEAARASFEAASEADLEEGVARFPAVLAARLANKHRELGELYAEGGALEEAAEQFRRALEIRPRFVDIRDQLGRALLDLGRIDEGIGELERALAVNPAFLSARINLGLAWYRKGQIEAAEREWQRCHEQRPDHRQVLAYLALLGRRFG